MPTEIEVLQMSIAGSLLLCVPWSVRHDSYSNSNKVWRSLARDKISVAASSSRSDPPPRGQRWQLEN
jgi:hypothetical protein